jgi:very-long-chain enoyl-CoA reductase
VPFGYGFTFVSCPNYFFEIVGWAAIAVMTGSVAGMSSALLTFACLLKLLHQAWVFTALATGIMSIWALKKHRSYKKEFGKAYPGGRKAIIPFIL